MRDSIHHPLLRELYDLWETLRAGRPLPRRADFDPFRLPRLLPFLIVNAVERSPGGKVRFRIRLEGEGVVQARGKTAKGRYLDEPGVIVLGSGVVGVTSAWYLARAGHEVTVLDRQQAAGMETSFANAGHGTRKGRSGPTRSARACCTASRCRSPATIPSAWISSSSASSTISARRPAGADARFPRARLLDPVRQTETAR